MISISCISSIHPEFIMYYTLKFFFFAFLFPASFVRLTQANELLLADYSVNNSQAVSGTFQTFGTGTALIGAFPSGFDEISSLKLQNYDANSGWGIVHIKNFDEVQNINGYQSLEFSFYSEGNDTLRTVSIQLRFTPGDTPYPNEDYVPEEFRGEPPVENVWEMNNKTLLSIIKII